MTRNDTAKRENIGEGPRAKDGCPCCTRNTRADEKRARRAAQAREMRERLDELGEDVVAWLR